MWWKLLLLLIYLAVLFILSRMLEIVAYYEAGYISSKLLDPVSLSVKKLKMLLDQRGVSYAGVIEKLELTELVDTSGEVVEGELDIATNSDEKLSVTNFTCGSHFYEEVEDSKDSVWVVQVIKDKNSSFLQSHEWHEFLNKVSRFGINTGIFDCSQDERMCLKKNWFDSKIMMALPRGFRAKDDVVLQNFVGPNKVQNVFDWVNYNLASRVQKIESNHEFENDWLQFKNNEVKVHVTVFSKLKIPPMFFSVLSVKFAGRVKFGMVDIETENGKQISQNLDIKKFPSYSVITSEYNFSYGNSVGQYLNYPSVALLLRTLHPEVNDLFLLLIIFINITCLFELCVTQSTLIKRLANALLCVIKWNCFLIFLWLPIMGLTQMPYINSVLEYTLKILRIISSTSFACKIRFDWLLYTSLHPEILIFSLMSYILTISVVHYYYKITSPVTITHPAILEGRTTNWENYTSYFFQPENVPNDNTDNTETQDQSDSELDLGMELLMERLALPNFWLRPMISTDYIKDLPTWRYSGHAVDSDVCSDVDSTKSDYEDNHYASEGPSRCNSTESLISLPEIFTCEVCRDLQRQIDDQHKSDEEIEEERLDQESACAKFVMDGDYKCMCKSSCGSFNLPKLRSSNCSNIKSRTRSSSSMSSIDDQSKPGLNNDETVVQQMPAGMLLVTECAICLESYKFNVMLCGLPCGHSFHHVCITGWLARDNHCCPVCRWPPYKAKPCQIHLHSD